MLDEVYILFAGWEVRIVKNPHFQPEGTVFHYTDRPQADQYHVYLFSCG